MNTFKSISKTDEVLESTINKKIKKVKTNTNIKNKAANQSVTCYNT